MTASCAINWHTAGRTAPKAASLLIYCEPRYGVRFDEDPAMAAVFDAAAQGEAFPETLARVPAEDWRRMREAAA